MPRSFGILYRCALKTTLAMLYGWHVVYFFNRRDRKALKEATKLFKEKLLKNPLKKK